MSEAHPAHRTGGLSGRVKARASPASLGRFLFAGLLGPNYP